MIFQFFIIFFSLVGLLILHEFGHFILAKKFGVKVEEFGIGYPPRLIGKKIGETIYSLNLLPFGAFVKIPGEIERLEDPRSFSRQPIGKRILIAFGGVLSFWIISAIILSVVFNLGALVAIEDTADSNLQNPKVQIAEIAPNSPAQIAGLRPGDTIKQISFGNEKIFPLKIKEVQDFTNNHLGQEITLTIERQPTFSRYPEILEVKLVPRISPPRGEGPMGMALVKTAIKKYPWYRAIFQGTLATGNITLAIIQGYFQAISNVSQGLPSGVQLMGPVGVFHLLIKASQVGFSYFLNFLALISIYLALFNVLPIPAADGGKLLFLGIEAIRKKPINPKIEQNITTAFFTLIIALAIWVTIKDIERLF